MFSFKTMKLSMLGRINLDSQEIIVPRIVREKPRFGRKMSADKSSLFSDALYQENLPLDCVGQDRHIWSDASIDHYVMTMIRGCGIAGELEHFVIERRSSLKHGRTLIITPQDGDNISRLLKVFEEVVKEDKLDIFAQDLKDLRTLATAEVFLSRSITKTCYMARYQECLIISYPGSPLSAACRF
ncbi:hypothetical protein NCC49_001561 [Naganishia albida]|nr:hypothetical protein NCC49_001561 [Naganishia albida]